MSAAVAEIAQAVQATPDAFIDERDRRRLQYFTARMVSGYDAAPHITDHLIPALEWAVSTPGARLIVTMPPRFSKSLHVSENLPPWYLGNNPTHRVIGSSHTAQLAYTFSRRVRNKMLDPRYPFAVTVADDKGAVQAWDTSEGGGYLAVGTGGSPTGHGGNGIIIDDPIRSAADADSQTVRDALWEWYQGTIRTRLEPGGWIIVTATRWHEDDLTGRLLREAENGGEQWRHLHLAAVDDDGASLWPSRWSVDDLAAIRSAVGSRAWDAQYMGAPTPGDGGVIKRHWFNTYQSRPLAVPIVQSWDTAFKDGKTSDYSVCVTMAYTETERWILDVYRARLQYPDLERMAKQMYAQWQPHAVLVEDKASGQSLVQSLARETDIPVIPIPVTRDKIARANEMAPVIESGRVRLPEAAMWLSDYLNEVSAFPLGTHDDQVDATMQALKWVQGRTIGGGQGGSWIADDDEDDDYGRWQ